MPHAEKKWLANQKPYSKENPKGKTKTKLKTKKVILNHVVASFWITIAALYYVVRACSCVIFWIWKARFNCIDPLHRCVAFSNFGFLPSVASLFLSVGSFLNFESAPSLASLYFAVVAHNLLHSNKQKRNMSFSKKIVHFTSGSPM